MNPGRPSEISEKKTTSRKGFVRILRDWGSPDRRVFRLGLPTSHRSSPTWYDWRMATGWTDREITLIVDPKYSSWLSVRHPVPTEIGNGVIKHHQNIPIKHQTSRAVLISRLRKRLCFSNQTCPNHCLGVFDVLHTESADFCLTTGYPKVPPCL